MTGPQTPLAGPQTTLAGLQTPLAGLQTPLAGLQIPLVDLQTHLDDSQTPWAPRPLELTFILNSSPLRQAFGLALTPHFTVSLNPYADAWTNAQNFYHDFQDVVPY